MAHFRIAGEQFELEQSKIEACLGTLLPDPVQEHYVVVKGRRFPPKQVLACVTGLDRADFTTHQARRVLRRLGFVAARATHDEGPAGAPAGSGAGPGDGRQAEALRPHIGKWVALAGPTEVLVAADSPQEVLAWLARHERRAPYGMFRDPVSPAEAEGAAPE
jgi:hypothetical protein